METLSRYEAFNDNYYKMATGKEPHGKRAQAHYYFLADAIFLDLLRKIGLQGFGYHHQQDAHGRTRRCCAPPYGLFAHGPGILCTRLQS